MKQFLAILEAAERKGLCRPVVRPNAILNEIFETLTEHRNRVAIFHYGGHAGGDRLFLESTGTAGAVVHAWFRSSMAPGTRFFVTRSESDDSREIENLGMDTVLCELEHGLVGQHAKTPER